MLRTEMSPFLQAVLDAVARSGGLSIDSWDEPHPEDLLRMAGELAATTDEVRAALLGLLAGHALIEDALELPGIAPCVRWEVHPQCLLEESDSPN